MASLISAFSYNDMVLLMSLLYLCVDMQFSWHEFDHCRWPIHRWLLVSYAFIVGFRVVHVAGQVNSSAESGDFLLNLRHKGMLSRALISAVWGLLLPLFLVWTVVGSYWLWDSKSHSSKCLPMGMLFTFISTWLALSYVWIIVHMGVGVVAFTMERRLRNAEFNLRAIEDADMLVRWGQVSQLSGYMSLANGLEGGLTPSEIASLPDLVATTADAGCECPICLCDVQVGDNVRQLQVCGHTFHRSCLDLWLLRRADCPLCKRNVRTPSSRVRSNWNV
jgi:hypothetical protein|mmetsp:Transcript_51501/g.81684  ORF Transcript_51501/g.81684 Transcript_51501/m.81684 type:complete len:277 (-) Transcript_51501:83-913(-)|eukprot:CAMPEP_0169112982 /NCGR_PEP_ID=MMETSP1015-20121227/27943_1 /TAXON_ID=342587 /ORGANISM="Karlodinium micrum, Strain CCMP2283" /LENGTH=276 /DNA_ID=CAMNT_0009175091 /DNA_START=73 /DNA_END=903 /DNA_ORIENTATION=-